MKLRLAIGAAVLAGIVTVGAWLLFLSEGADETEATARLPSCAPPQARLRKLDEQPINAAWSGTSFEVTNDGRAPCMLRGRLTVRVPSHAPYRIRVVWGHGGDFFSEPRPTSVLPLEPGRKAGALLITERVCAAPIRNGTEVAAMVRMPAGGAGVRMRVPGCRNENSATTLFIGPFWAA
jgi:hypothetical protein